MGRLPQRTGDKNTMASKNMFRPSDVPFNRSVPEFSSPFIAPDGFFYNIYTDPVESHKNQSWIIHVGKYAIHGRIVWICMGQFFLPQEVRPKRWKFVSKNVPKLLDKNQHKHKKSCKNAKFRSILFVHVSYVSHFVIFTRPVRSCLETFRKGTNHDRCCGKRVKRFQASRFCPEISEAISGSLERSDVLMERIRRENQLRLVVSPIIYKVFVHSRW